MKKTQEKNYNLEIILSGGEQVKTIVHRRFVCI